MYATTRYNFVRLKATHKISSLEELVGGSSQRLTGMVLDVISIHKLLMSTLILSSIRNTSNIVREDWNTIRYVPVVSPSIWISSIMRRSLFMFNNLRWHVIVRFLDIGGTVYLVQLIWGTHSLWYIMSESKIRNVTKTTMHIKSLLFVFTVLFWNKNMIYLLFLIHTQPSKHGEHSDFAPKECSDMLLLQESVSLSHRAHLWDSPSPKQ